MRVRSACGEGLDARRHVVWRSVEPPRQADDECGDTVVLGAEPRQLGGGTLDGVAVEPGRLQHADRSRQRAGGIADRHTDPTFADIQTCHTSHAV